MGQYRLWLHYREVDRQLHTELELLEEKLAALQEQAGRLQAAASTDNVIVQALQAFLRTAAEAAPDTTPDGLPEHVPSNGIHAGYADSAAMATEQPTGAISRALFAWSNLPNIDMQAISGLALKAGPSIPTPDLLPEDDLLPAMPGARDQQSIARLQAPRWLANLAPSSRSSSMLPVDQQSIRADLLIQRWLERWGRRFPDRQASQEEGQ
jgi:hypothetical protein